MGYVTEDSFKEYQIHQERICLLRVNGVEKTRDAKLAAIEQKIDFSNLLMKFTAALVSVSLAIFGLAIRFGWI